MTIARIYGNSIGQSSLAVVTEGFRSAFEQAGILAGTCYVDERDPDFDAIEGPGADARFGVFVGSLKDVDQIFERGRHHRHFIMVTPNSDRIPRELVTRLGALWQKHQIHWLSPSTWAAGVVLQELGGECIVVPHGVSPEYRVHVDLSAAARRVYLDQGIFHALHFSTSDRSRKGTLELIRAWKMLDDDRSRLACVLDPHAATALRAEMQDEGIAPHPRIRFVDRLGAAPEDLSRLLATSHAVVQPSRGEGFGLIPLQALACGVPVVATNTTGHSEYMRDKVIGGLVVVPSGPLAALDDLPGSIGPSVKPEDIASALWLLRTRWGTIQERALAEAPEWQRCWSWQASLSGFIRQLKEYAGS